MPPLVSLANVGWLVAATTHGGIRWEYAGLLMLFVLLEIIQYCFWRHLVRAMKQGTAVPLHLDPYGQLGADIRAKRRGEPRYPPAVVEFDASIKDLPLWKRRVALARANANNPNMLPWYQGTAIGENAAVAVFLYGARFPDIVALCIGVAYMLIVAAIFIWYGQRGHRKRVGFE